MTDKNGEQEYHVPQVMGQPDLRLRDLAACLSIGMRKAYEMVAAGAFPGAYRMSDPYGEWRVPQASLDQFRQSRAMTASAGLPRSGKPKS